MTNNLNVVFKLIPQETQKSESSYFDSRKSLPEVKTFFRFLEILSSFKHSRALHFNVTWMSYPPDFLIQPKELNAFQNIFLKELVQYSSWIKMEKL